MASDPIAQTSLEYWLRAFGVPIVTFGLGFAVSRFTMTKKETEDHKTSLLDRSNALSEARADAFERLAAALSTYSERPDNPTFQDFYQIATTGEAYFAQLRITCDAILAGRLDKTATTNSHLPIIRDAVERVLPNFFATLGDIAQRNGIPYSGELRRSDYESIYRVYEKFAGPIPPT